MKSCDLDRVEGRYVLKFETVIKGDFSGTVRIPIEGLVLFERDPGPLTEKNLMKSGLAYDLNGDGDTEDVFSVENRAEQWFLGGIPVEAFAQDINAQKTRQARTYRLKEGGPEILVYRLGEVLALGVPSKPQSSQFLETPNPNVQVLLLERKEKPSGAPRVWIEGSQNVVYSWEPGLFTSDPQWVCVQSQFLPADRAEQLEITGKGEAMLLIMSNHSLDGQTRIRKLEFAENLEL